MARKIVITLIVLLIVLNLGVAGFFYWRFKVAANSLMGSASSATVQNFLKFSFSQQKLPDADVAGEDPANIGRFKTSVRTKYEKTDASTTYEYVTKDSPVLVMGFYKNKLATNGWIMQSANENKLIFTKDEKTIIVTVQTDQASLLTNYTIVL